MDSGFSWVILLASTFNFTLYAGIIRTFGVLYAELLQQNEDASSKIAFVSSLQIFISAVAAMVSGQTSIHFSFKWTTVIGGIIAAVGMATSSFVIHNGYLYLTYSLILGSGLGMMHNSSITIINFYFEKKRAFANGVFASGVGISSLFFPTLYRTLFDEYGIRGALLILGGILLNICVAGFAFRQPKQFQNKINAPGKNEEKIKSSHTIETTTNGKSKIYRLKLIKIKEHILKTFKVYKTVWTNKSIFLYFLSFSFVLVGNSGLILVLPSYLKSENYLKGDVIKLLTVYGASDLAARYLLGLLIDRQWLTVQTFYSLFMIIGGVLCIGILYAKSLPMFYIIMIMYSTFPGARFQCRPLLFVNVCQLEDLPSVFALQNFVSNTTVMIMFPVLGLLEDLTGSWNATIYSCSASLFSADFLVIFERILVEVNNRSLKEKAQAEECVALQA